MPCVFSFRLAIVGPHHVERELVTDLFKRFRRIKKFKEVNCGEVSNAIDDGVWNGKSSSAQSLSLKMQLGPDWDRPPLAILGKGAVGK